MYVHIPDNLTGQAGGQVTAPVEIDNAAGVRAAEIRISYDTAVLDTNDSSVQPGSVWPGGGATQIVVSVDDTAGTIIAQVFTAEGLGSGGGSLLSVQFSVAAGATVGDSTAIDLARVRLNEGEIVPNPEPQPGPDSTDGRITIVGAGDTASISGVVYADTNSNNSPDPLEGIPRVKIVLVNEGTSDQRETYTGDDGRYDFNDLPAGSYRVQEQQPAAFLDGGPNEITAQLADGQALADQNFRERGLAPRYVFNRLFTTLALPVGSTNWVSAIRTIVDTAGTAAASSQVVRTQATAKTANKTAVAGAVKPVAIASPRGVAPQQQVKPVLQQVAVTKSSAAYLAWQSSLRKRLKAVDRVFASSTQQLPN